MRYLGVSKNAFRQGSHLEKPTFLRRDLEKAVAADTALDLWVSQGVKTRFNRYLENLAP